MPRQDEGAPGGVDAQGNTPMVTWGDGDGQKVVIAPPPPPSLARRIIGSMLLLLLGASLFANGLLVWRFWDQRFLTSELTASRAELTYLRNELGRERARAERQEGEAEQPAR